MGEISGVDNIDVHQAQAQADVAITGEPGKVKTSLDGVFADGEKGGLPVFNVDKHSFYQNMTHGRKRLRLKSGTAGQAFMSQSKNNQPFWLSYENPENGEMWTRKVR